MKALHLLLLLVFLLAACAEPQPSAAPTQPIVPTATQPPPAATPTQPPAPPTVAPNEAPTLAPRPEAIGLKPGDQLAELTLRAAQSEQEMDKLLWDYCDPSISDQPGAQEAVECNAPRFERIFIGNGVGVGAGAGSEALDKAWAELIWELYIDDQPVNLPAFGTADVWGGGFRLWNVILENPGLGQHKIRYAVRVAESPDKRVEKTWLVTFKELAEFPELSLVLPEQPTPLPELTSSPRLGSGGLPWWNDRVFYEVFVRSFKDSDGDGIGDFQGLISQLDYLNDGDPTTTVDLGVTGIWLMPIAQSPSYHGYDTTDYETIEADYGTNEDFKQFLAAAHQRGIAVIVDLVMNHTSSQHPWFLDAQQPDSLYRNWYIWDDSPIPYSSPWGSQVWYPLGGSNYYALFWEGMPDLNYRNGDVTRAMREIIAFWLEDMQVDGFRLDAVRHLIEDGAVQANTPETHAWLADFHRYVHSLAPDALTVGEIWDTTEAVVPYVGDEVNLAFEFDLSTAIIEALKDGTNENLLKVQETVLESYGQGQYAAFLTNHDQNRVINTLQRDRNKAKVAASLLLTNPGVPFIYYGEEVGMRGVKPDELIRRPMQWDATPVTAGFTSGTPWQELNNDIPTVNVVTESTDPDSLLNHYRALIQLRNAHAALRTGDLWLVGTSSPQAYAFLRSTSEESFLVLVNLSKETLRDLSLTLARGPLSGPLQAQVALGEGEPAALALNSAGGFDVYRPLPELAPYATVIIQLTP